MGENMSKKKKIVVIVLVILAVFLSVGGYFGYKIYNDYVDPILTAMNSSEEEIKENADTRKKLEEKSGIEVRELTEEEKEAVESGEKTEEEVVEEIIKEAVPQGNEGEIKAKYLSKIYALEGEYNGKLEAAAYSAKTMYYDLRIFEKLSKDVAIKQTTEKYQPIVTAYEAECDAKINALTSEMEAELKKYGFSTQIVKDIKSTYANEKKNKRTYYMKIIMSGIDKSRYYGETKLTKEQYEAQKGN